MQCSEVTAPKYKFETSLLPGLEYKLGFISFIQYKTGQEVSGGKHDGAGAGEETSGDTENTE